MAEKSKDMAGVIAPPPLIFCVAILLGYGVSRLFPRSDWLVWLPPALGILVVGLGLAGLAWGLVTLKRARTAVNPYESTTALVQHGPYRYTRNPLYVALTTLHIGIGLWLHNIWILLAVVPAVLIVHYGVVLREERYLMRKFGEDYHAYCAQVRRWL